MPKPTQRLRFAVDALPTATKEAMLRGIAANRIVVGAYVDPRSGGICPMLAAHRNGGRTSLASFARAWDAYTQAKRPRLARRREVSTLTALLQSSLAAESLGEAAAGSVAEAAARIRDERRQLAARERVGAAESLVPPEPGDAEPSIRRRPTGERHRAFELRNRLRWSWVRPVSRYDEFKDLVAAAEEQLSEAVATDELREREHAR